MKLVNKVAHKDDMDASAFAMIDANTAQLHTAFGGLLVLSLVLSNFINISV
jgi:hypothetical protein